MHLGHDDAGEDVADGDIHLRMAGLETLDRRRQNRCGDRRQRGNRDPPAADFDELRELAEGSLELRENALGDRHQVLPGRGKLDVPRVAIEEPNADRVPRSGERCD